MSEAASLHFSLPFPDGHWMVIVAPGLMPIFMQDVEGQMYCWRSKLLLS